MGFLAKVLQTKIHFREKMASKVVRKIIQTSRAPAPVGPYSQAVAVDKTLYISGQIGMGASGDLVPGGVEAEAKQAMENMKAILEDANSSLDNVVKTTVLLEDISDWPKVNVVYQSYFTKHFPARAAYAVKALPKGAKVEIEAIAIIGAVATE